MATITRDELEELDREQLLDYAGQEPNPVKGRHNMKRDELIDAILAAEELDHHPANVGAPDPVKVDLSKADLEGMTKDELRDAADKAGLDTTQRMTHDELVALLSSSTAAQTVTAPDEQLNPPRRSFHDGTEADPARRSGLSSLPFGKASPKVHEDGSSIGRGSVYDRGQYGEGDDESA